MPLSEKELVQYMRHLNLPQVGEVGQEKLKASRVLCVGAGGLGSPLLLYLAAAGVGTIGVVDDDQVDVSNLQRQVLYSTEDVGLKKALVAKSKLKKLNPHIEIIAYDEALNEDNALSIILDYDVIADCTDNFYARYLINDACHFYKKPNVFASIAQFDGQCTVLCADGAPCYRCIYPEPPPPNLMPNCAEGGVLGVLPGLLGTIQAAEVIKILLGIGNPLVGRLLQVSSLGMEFNQFELEVAKDCVLCNGGKDFHTLERVNQACNVSSQVDEVSPAELKRLLENKEVYLLDVREPYEYKICDIGGNLIPLGELSNRTTEINLEQDIVVYCKAGKRSQQAAELLKQAGFKNVRSLQGGILGWIEKIDSSLMRY